MLIFTLSVSIHEWREWQSVSVNPAMDLPSVQSVPRFSPSESWDSDNQLGKMDG